MGAVSFCRQKSKQASLFEKNIAVEGHHRFILQIPRP